MTRKIHKKFHFAFPISEIKNNGHLTVTHIGDAICKGHTTLEVEYSQMFPNKHKPVLPLQIEVIFDSIQLNGIISMPSLDRETMQLMTEAAKYKNYCPENYLSLIKKQHQNL